MADMRVVTGFEDLRKNVYRLTSAVESLATLFEQETVHLKRKNEVDRLRLLCSATLQQVERERSTEISASTGYNQGKLIAQGAGLLIAILSQNKKMKLVARSLLADPAGEKRTFGTVLIRVDAKGLPDGVEVVCISRLGRESNQSEPEVINRLKKNSSLLLSEQNFSRLIDRLIEGILKGQIALPVSIQTLSQIQTPRPSRFIPHNKG